MDAAAPTLQVATAGVKLCESSDEVTAPVLRQEDFDKAGELT